MIKTKKRLGPNTYISDGAEETKKEDSITSPDGNRGCQCGPVPSRTDLRPKIPCVMGSFHGWSTAADVNAANPNLREAEYYGSGMILTYYYSPLAMVDTYVVHLSASGNKMDEICCHTLHIAEPFHHFTCRYSASCVPLVTPRCQERYRQPL